MAPIMMKYDQHGGDMSRMHEMRRATDLNGCLALGAYGKLIEDIACPAYCCTPHGAVLHCNGAARRLWGARPPAVENGHWDGFKALYRTDGSALEKSASPAALAARSGIAPPPTELVAESADGQRRCVVMHARPVGQADGVAAGVLCSLTDISARRRLESEVGLVRDGRSDFLHVLAHELRNPLAPVMAAAALLRRQPGELGVARMARVIERQTRQLARFIDDLLDGVRIEQACDIPVSMRAASVDEVLAHARDVVDGVLRQRGQTLLVEVGIEGPAWEAALWCDSARLAQALGNALLNASEFSDDGATIWLAVAVDGIHLEIRVTDHGIGVEADELLRMFEPFRKCSAHPRRVPSGAGLGLAIARSVSQAHGGMVSADSAGRGQGTCLRFILPVVREAVSG
jgi:signal transduction histidine kinase